MPPRPRPRGGNRRGAQSLNDLSGQKSNHVRPGPHPQPLLSPPHHPQHPLHQPHHPPHHPQHPPHPRYAGPYNGQGQGGPLGPPPGPYYPPMHHHGQANSRPRSPHGDLRWQEQNYNYASPYPGQGPPPLLGQPIRPPNSQWSYGGPGPATSNFNVAGNTGPRDNSQDIRSNDQSAGAKSKFIDLNALLLALIKAPDQKLTMDQICRQFSCSMRALKTVCFHNSTLFKDPLQGDKAVVELFPNLVICEDYLDDSGCRNEGHCGRLHICLSFVRSDCNDRKDCDFGHNWKTKHNLQLWSLLKMECLASYTNLLRNLVKKVIMSQERLSVCVPYNSGVCNSKSCSSLHICSSTVCGGAKCDADKCTLNHDIFEPQCKAILQHFGINIDDSKRDVITKVRVELEKQSQENKSKEKQANRKTSIEKDSTNGSTGEATVSTQLSFFSSIAEQEDAVRAIVKSLLVTNDFWNSTDQMCKLVNLKPSELRLLIEHYSHVFRVHVSGAKVLFKLRPRLQMCRLYSQERGCDARDSCHALHLCQKHMNGYCNDDSCQFNHSLMAQQNKDIIRRCFLDGVPQKLVLNYFKRRFAIADVPSICIPYNEERCNAVDCDDLHICSDRLFTVGSCFKNNCVLNHDLFDEENAMVLEKYNFKNLSQREIQSIFSIRINTSRGKKASTEATPVNKNSSSSKQSAPKPKEKISKAQSTKPKTARAPAPKVSTIPGITSSYALEGNVARPEICLDALSTNCQPGSQGCPKLHSRVAYHWQFALDNLWYNFSVNHSNALETAFRDVSTDSVTLTPASYGRTPAEKQRFAFMEDGPLVVDFDQMGLKTKRPLNVRRLSTPSSVVSSSNFAIVYGWYFQDRFGQWVEYGNADSSMIETHSSKETSTDIERVYLSNMNGSLYITTERFNYNLDFVQMNQTNQSTLVARSIRRRPKYALIEKLNPNDPYGLKTTKADQSQSTKSVSDRKSTKSSEVANNRKSTKSYEDERNSEVAKNDRPPTRGAMGPNFPSFWSKMVKEGVECFTVDLSSQEAFDIISSVLLTMPSADVIRIRRLQNTFHWEGFSNQMDYFKIATKKPLNIQRLFHGTREKYVDSISSHNFEWRQSFADTGNMYGRGAYFFNNAAVAHTFAGAMQAEAGSGAVVLAIADVFVGSIAVGTREMTRPPPKQAGSAEICHTTVNDLSLPTIFVKYDKSHYCPHYFVDLKP